MNNFFVGIDRGRYGLLGRFLDDIAGNAELREY